MPSQKKQQDDISDDDNIAHHSILTTAFAEFLSPQSQESDVEPEAMIEKDTELLLCRIDSQSDSESDGTIRLRGGVKSRNVVKSELRAARRRSYTEDSISCTKRKDNNEESQQGGSLGSDPLERKRLHSVDFSQMMANNESSLHEDICDEIYDLLRPRRGRFAG